MPAPIVTFKPDRFADGRVALFKFVDGVRREQVDVHFDQSYIESRATELNRIAILETLFIGNDPITNAAKQLASVILEHTPRSADQSTALRCIREAVLWARQAITLDGYA